MNFCLGCSPLTSQSYCFNIREGGFVTVKFVKELRIEKLIRTYYLKSMT